MYRTTSPVINAQRLTTLRGIVNQPNKNSTTLIFIALSIVNLQRKIMRASIIIALLL